MGSSHARRLAALAAGAADFIAEFPQAAAFFARRLSQLLDAEAYKAEELEQDERQEHRRRGFGG